MNSVQRHGYETGRPDVLAHVPQHVTRILELGCSNGALGSAIKARQEATILGVELDPAYAAIAASRLDRVVVGDASSFVAERPDEAPFDCIICADVLEHLLDPWRTLSVAASWLGPGGTAVISLPNVLYYQALYRLLRTRRWPRDEEGIFDRTHLRWFTLRDAIDLVQQADLSMTTVEFRLWTDEATQSRVLRALQHTPLRSFVAAQHIIVAQRAD